MATTPNPVSPLSPVRKSNHFRTSESVQFSPMFLGIGGARALPGDVRVGVDYCGVTANVVRVAGFLAELRTSHRPRIHELIRRTLEAMAEAEHGLLPMPPRCDYRPPRLHTPRAGIAVGEEVAKVIDDQAQAIFPDRQAVHHHAKMISPWLAAVACVMAPDTLNLWPTAGDNQTLYMTARAGTRGYCADRSLCLSSFVRDLRDNRQPIDKRVLEWWGYVSPVVGPAMAIAAEKHGWS